MKTKSAVRHSKPKPASKITARKDAGAARARPASLNAAQMKTYAACSNAAFHARKKSISTLALLAGKAQRQFTVVAEGDSWFDYKPAFIGIGTKDLLGHLQTSGRINVYRVSKAGDTLENMIYGTDTTGKGPDLAPDLPPQIEKTLAAIRDRNADAFFFSGGGNDLAGVELAGYLNHKDSGLPTLREDTLEVIFGGCFVHALNTLIMKVRQIKPGIPIFLHGYDYAIPDGRYVKFLGFTFSGPWLKPALIQKRYVSPAEGAQIARMVTDRFNEALSRVAAEHADVHYINLRGTLRADGSYQKDWANELHPTSDGFKKVASIIEQTMLAILDVR